MRRRIAVVLALFIAVTNGSALAQSRAAHKPPAHTAPPMPWEAEPDSFMGLRLGESFSQQIQQCSTTNMLGYNGPICSSASLNGMALLEGYPQLGVVMRVTGSYSSDTLQSVSISVKHYDYDQLKAILLKRYGQPTLEEAVEYRTVGGAPVEGARLHWSGKRVSILLSEYADDLNRSIMTIGMNSASAGRQSDLDRSAEKQAGKL